MSHQLEPCEDRRLRLLLTAAEDSTEYKTAATHVESCLNCQTRLGALAADVQEWSEARELLTTNGDDLQIEQELRDRPRRLSEDDRTSDDDRSAAFNSAVVRQLLSPPSHPEMLGRLGRYEIERLIGAGGMGVVFKGFDTELNRPVAIKALAPHLAGSGAARQRFAREARAAAAIVHEHVVAIHDVESEQDPPFLVMQYVAGHSLQARIDRDGPLSICEILRIARQTASALAAAHEQGLVHRDVKPANILLEHQVDRALLTDFGLARASDDASLTRSGHLPGTPHYMSPEQARGEAVDPRSDLFSLGSVLYAMCAGRPPFRAESSLGVLRRITDSEPRPLREINPQVPTWLCRLVEKLHAKHPGDRFQSASQVAELLQCCLAHVQHPESHALPESLLESGDRDHAAKARTRVTSFAVIASTLVLTGLGALAVFLPRWHSSPADDHNAGPSPRTVQSESSTSGASVVETPAPPAADVSTQWDDEVDAALDRVEESIQQLDGESRQLFDVSSRNSIEP
ncbi:MAG: serine/threonine-protein kinase [Pirellulaceae bacterium]